MDADSEDVLMENANECLTADWLGRHRLTLAPEKTEAVIIKGGRSTDNILFNLESVRIITSRTVVYLGILMDDKLKFDQHVGAAILKTEDKLAKLTRLMPNIGRLGSLKRTLLSSATSNIILYGGPVWEKVLY